MVTFVTVVAALAAVAVAAVAVAVAYLLLQQLDHLLHAVVDALLPSLQHQLRGLWLLILLVNAREPCDTQTVSLTCL